MEQKTSTACLYKVVSSEEYGRYLVAARDIPERSLVILEEPLIVAPADDVRDEASGKVPLCLSCFVQCKGNRCSKCNWPVCDANCSEMVMHAGNECKIFSQNLVAFPSPFTWPILHKTILVLRTLLLKENNPLAWIEFLLKLEHHSKIRATKPACSKGDEMIVKNILYFYEKSRSGCPFSDEEIKTISGVVNVNSFCAVKTDDNTGFTRRAKCVFQEASLLSHSCSPNCSWDIDIVMHASSSSPTVQMKVFTAVPIRKDEMFTIPYSTRYIMFGTLKRIVSMESIAHFICKCNRCCDPTECGTFFSAIRCFNCEDDYLLPVNPVDIESRWKCKLCDKTENVGKVVYAVFKIENQFDFIQSLELSPEEEVEKLQLLHDKNRGKFLHPNHYVLQEISTRIVEIFVNGLFQNVSQEKLDLFILHCELLLKVANSLVPGFTTYRDKLQHYLNEGKIARRAQRQMNYLDLAENYTKLSID